MNKYDYLGLDGYTLRTFLTVLEETSVSKAALRLGMSQSAVSHTLDRLRLAFDDALFVRDGRGIIPTAKAVSLREPIESVINNLKSFAEQREFDPLVDSLEFTIATNDFPMLLIFPRLIKKLQSKGINPRFHFYALRRTQSQSVAGVALPAADYTRAAKSKRYYSGAAVSVKNGLFL